MMEEVRNFSTAKEGLNNRDGKFHRETRSFAQAYDQAPWRKQLQMIAVFLLLLVTTALVAGIYLSVTAQAATTGRQIQEMQIRMYGSHRIDLVDSPELTGALQDSAGSSAATQNTEALTEVIPIEELRMQIADLEARLAYLKSTSYMRPRALEMGFIPTQSETITYLKVPGYQSRQTIRLAPPPSPVASNPAVLSPIYRESLIDWLDHQLTLAIRGFSQEVQP